MCLETVFFHVGGISDSCAFLPLFLPFLLPLLGSLEGLVGLARGILCPLLGFINI